MNQDLDVISQMQAITTAREYGSGGGEIATRLARHLGWQLIDHEVVVLSRPTWRFPPARDFERAIQ